MNAAPRLLGLPLMVSAAALGGLPFRAHASAPDPIQSTIAEALRPLDGYPLRTGVLYDRVLPLSGIERFDGAPGSHPATLATWLQLYDEIRRASAPAPFQPEPAVLAAAARQGRMRGVVPLAVLDARYERLAPDALERVAPRLREGRMPPGEAPLVEGRVFAAAPLVERTYRGAEVRFALDRSLCFTNDEAAPRRIEMDFGDGQGYREIEFGQVVAVRYDRAGERMLRLRLTAADGSTRFTSARFTVESLTTPLPDDTLRVTATVPYQGAYATGDAYVRLAPSHATLANPVILVEGFDLDNSMDWDELYAQMNQQGLADSLAAAGFDAVVLNFADATDHIQKNGFVVGELIRQVEAMIPPSATLAVIGASMGGLCSRYALAYLESQLIPHRVRTWIAFDSPQGGADIPLGVQYWVNFFAGQSAEAAALRDALNRPAARQMLVYHYTDPPGGTGQPDPLRAGLLADFALVGDYPALPRRVAIVNGSGTRADQGFLPGDQLIQYVYSSALVAITGNVWAVPDQTSTMIFDGRIRILLSTTSQQVTVSGTLPFDGAPGGWRGSMAQMDAVVPPYGDIVALHPNHCFIPTISALGLATSDLFYDVVGDPDLVAQTPYDAVHVPAGNQEHAGITAENAAWFLAEIEQGVVGAPGAALALQALRGFPNPFVREARIGFSLAHASEVDVSVFGVDGRRVRTLMWGPAAAGPHELRWDGRDAGGRPVAPGIYFLRLAQGERAETRRLVKLQ